MKSNAITRTLVTLATALSTCVVVAWCWQNQRQVCLAAGTKINDQWHTCGEGSTCESYMLVENDAYCTWGVETTSGYNSYLSPYTCFTATSCTVYSCDANCNQSVVYNQPYVVACTGLKYADPNSGPCLIVLRDAQPVGFAAILY
jgi:hypothetical protein